MPHPADSGVIDVTVANLPTGWHIDDAQQQQDGSWHVATTDASSLTLTTPADFAGAAVLDLAMSWTDADGVSHTVNVANNVEAFAPGTPIFAWSGDDTLTGSAGADTFVFSQPIGADTVHGFDTAQDVVDLIDYGQIGTFADVIAHTADDAAGNAVVDLGGGQSITFAGVHTADLTADNFEFDVQHAWSNAGSMTIGNGAMLPVSGALANTGTIELRSAGDATLLQIIQHGLMLTGGGSLVLSDSASNMIAGANGSVTMTNVDNTISGAGQLGGGSLTLVNSGTILADGANALVIDTGTNVVANSGRLEATRTGGLSVLSALDNSGHLWANGGGLVFAATVTGVGDATISGTGAIEFDGSSSANVLFDGSAAGTLTLAAPALYSGTVSGFDGNDAIKFAGLAFDQASSLSYAGEADGLGGMLTVVDGDQTVELHLSGQYAQDEFALTADAHGGTLLTVTPHDLLIL